MLYYMDMIVYVLKEELLVYHFRRESHISLYNIYKYKK